MPKIFSFYLECSRSSLSIANIPSLEYQVDPAPASSVNVKDAKVLRLN
jgi:hypothetical protein